MLGYTQRRVHCYAPAVRLTLRAQIVIENGIEVCATNAPNMDYTAIAFAEFQYV